MRKEFLETGKIVGTHGVRGMVRIQVWADSTDFLNSFSVLYLKEGAEKIKISSIKPHGNVAIAKIAGVDTIEQAEALRNRVLYIKRKDVALADDRYFVSEIIGSNVFDADSGALLGTLSDVSQTGANDVWHIENGGKEYLVPAIPQVIDSVDIDENTIKIRPLKGIFEDED